MMAMLRSLLLLFMMFSMWNAEVHSSGKCPDGWANFGDQCFKFFPEKVDWVTAEKNCQSLGANLASEHSKPEHDFLTSLLPDSYTNGWLGAHDGEKEGQWLWTDGSVFGFANWCSDQPDNSGGHENCGHIYSLHQCVNDVDCSAEIGYICATD